MNAPGHANRIFSIKFSKSDPTVLASGGWDKCVIVWDLVGKIMRGTNMGSTGAKSEVHGAIHMR